VEAKPLKPRRLVLFLLLGLSVSCGGLLPHDRNSGAARGDRLLASSTTAFWRGQLGAAVGLARESLHEAVATDDTGLQAEALFTLAGIHHWCEHRDSALALADQGISLALLAGDPCLHAEGLVLRCAVMFAAGGLSGEGLDSLRAVVSRCDAPSPSAHLALLEARLAVRAGEPDKARSLLARQPDLGVSGDLRAQMEQEKLFLDAHVLASEGKSKEAVVAAEAVLRMDRRDNRRPAIADDLWALARLHLDAGDVQAARNAAERALSVVRAMSPPEMTARRREALANWIAAIERSVG
jgi:tetratricopeptide (TPR) repeat protein